MLTRSADASRSAVQRRYARLCERVPRPLGCGAPLDAVTLAPGEGVLDLGCGAGDALVLSAQRTAPDGFAIGVDMTPPMIDRARTRIREARLPNADVRAGTIEAIPVADGIIDCVISNCVICLSPEKERVFAEIARVLKPGGRVSIADIVVESPPRWLRWLLRMRGSCLVLAASQSVYLEGLAQAGLEHVRVEQPVVYDAARLRTLIDPNLPRFLWRTPALAEFIANTLAKIGWRAFRGQLASVRITGRKPAEG